MEVSSLGLDQSRVNGVPFHNAIFTNLTRDHLDYHGTMEAYGAIRSRPCSTGMVCNTPSSISMTGTVRNSPGRLKRLSRFSRLRLYGFNEQADIRITDFTASSDGMEAVFPTPWGEGKCRTRLLGRFNSQNLAACVALLCANSYPLNNVLEVRTKSVPASGRMDCIMNSGKLLVVVDYAHTPDALENALHFAGNQTSGERPYGAYSAAVATETSANAH